MNGEVSGMRMLGGWLVLAVFPLSLAAAPVRVARVSELEGPVEVQLHASDAWRPAVRNLPLVESTWVRTGPGARVRLEARDDSSQFAVIEGRIRFSSPAAEMDLGENQTARVENAARARFFLYREITPLDTDGWNEQRDKALASSGSAGHVPGL